LVRLAATLLRRRLVLQHAAVVADVDVRLDAVADDLRLVELLPVRRLALDGAELRALALPLERRADGVRQLLERRVASLAPVARRRRGGGGEQERERGRSGGSHGVLPGIDRRSRRTPPQSRRGVGALTLSKRACYAAGVRRHEYTVELPHSAA